MLDSDNEKQQPLELEFENDIINSLEENQGIQKKNLSFPEEVYVFPLVRRPFFPEWQHLSSLNRDLFMKC